MIHHWQTLMGRKSLAGSPWSPPRPGGCHRQPVPAVAKQAAGKFRIEKAGTGLYLCSIRPAWRDSLGRPRSSSGDERGNRRALNKRAMTGYRDMKPTAYSHLLSPDRCELIQLLHQTDV